MVAKADSSLTIEFYPERLDPETHPQIMKEKGFPYKVAKDNFCFRSGRNLTTNQSVKDSSKGSSLPK